jgi:hypothetical protein
MRTVRRDGVDEPGHLWVMQDDDVTRCDGERQVAKVAQRPQLPSINVWCVAARWVGVGQQRTSI